MTETLRLRESLKTALAMTIAIGVSLALDWDKPYWAGLAVALCSLATIGQSLQKASLRMLGTLVAMLVALIVLGLFVQHPWWLVATLSLWGAFCCYMMIGSSRAYFWNVCWFVAIILVVNGGANPVNVFQVSIMRLMETGLGVLVYSLVSIFVWPQHARAPFMAATAGLVTQQRQLLQACLAMMTGRQDPAEFSQMTATERKGRADFEQLLQAAIADSGDVWELKGQWRGFQRQLDQFSLVVTRWRETFTEVEKLELRKLLPDLETFAAELDFRQEQMGLMLSGTPPARQPDTITLSFNREALNTLSPLQRAAVAVSRDHLLEIERVTRDQFEILSDIRGFNRLAASQAAVPVTTSPVFFVPDPDRLAGSVRLVLMVWLSYLAGVYISDLPGGFTMMVLVGSIGIIMATTPQMRITLPLYVPVAAAIAFAAMVYVFIMPALSGYLGLGTMIFVVTFAICYIGATPKMAIGRSLGLSMFLSLCGFTNHQAYSFLGIPTTLVVIIGVFTIMNLFWYFPFNLYPERVFLRQLRRFFRSSDYLVSSLQGKNSPTSWLERWQHAFHSQEVALLPAKLAGWSRAIKPGVVAGTSQESIQALVTSVESLGLQLRQLLAQQAVSESGEAVKKLPAEFDLWQRAVQSSLQRLASGSDLATASQDLLKGLEGLGQQLTSLIANSFEQNQDRYSAQQIESYYRALEACRGASKALFNCTRIMAAIDWTPWREERFA